MYNSKGRKRVSLAKKRKYESQNSQQKIKKMRWPIIHLDSDKAVGWDLLFNQVLDEKQPLTRDGYFLREFGGISQDRNPEIESKIKESLQNQIEQLRMEEKRTWNLGKICFNQITPTSKRLRWYSML